MEDKIEKFTINVSLNVRVTDNMNKIFFTEVDNYFELEGVIKI